jgi:hypothetical protein
MTASPMIDELLLRGADDWVMAADVAWVVKSVCGPMTEEGLVDTSVNLIRTVIDQGLMKVGDVSDGGFFEWDLSTKETVERVERQWKALGRQPDLGEVCWLANTSKGDLRANAIREDEKGERGDA